MERNGFNEIVIYDQYFGDTEDNWVEVSIELTEEQVEIGQYVRIKFENHFYRWGRLKIDNVNFSNAILVGYGNDFHSDYEGMGYSPEDSRLFNRA